MKHSLLYLILFLTFQSCAQPTAVQTTLNQLIEYTEQHSLYRENVGWDTLRSQMYDLAKEAQKVEDLGPALKHMLKALNDEHGRIFHNNQILAFYSAGLKPYQKSFDSNLYNLIQYAQTYPFLAQKINDDIGYVRIVGLPMGDNEKMTKDILDAVCPILEAKVSKWIVDLRYNGGGNMFPMIEGISAIAGDGMVGGTAGVNAEESSTWEIKADDFYYDDYSIAVKKSCTYDLSPKVAVLTSLYTASSGEALAVIFKGRKNTRFFGEKTLGMITSTNWQAINDSIAINISESYYKDRNGTVYKDYVDVDEYIPFEPTQQLEADSAILKAIEWLNETH